MNEKVIDAFDPPGADLAQDVLVRMPTGETVPFSVIRRGRMAVTRGGAGSGHEGHRGRQGEVGGSLPSGATGGSPDYQTDESAGQEVQAVEQARVRIRHNPNMPHEAQAKSTKDGVDVELGENFWKLPSRESKAWVLSHEVGHEIMDRYLGAGGSDFFWQVSDSLTAPASEQWGGDVPNFIWGTDRADEALSESYAVYTFEGSKPFKDRGGKYLDALRFVEEAISAAPEFNLKKEHYMEMANELPPDRPEIQAFDTLTERGGKGSGHHGHRGRPGQRGGSLPAVSGECYMASAKWIMGDGKALEDNAMLVHGTVAGQGSLDGLRISHAWVEFGDLVYDAAAEMLVRKERYYEIGKVKDTVKYTPTEMRVNLLKTENWGPWDERFEGGPWVERGGAGSGYHDPHFGRPGERGGSSPRKGSTIKQPIEAIKKGLFHYHQADEIWGGQKTITQEQAIGFFKDMGFDESHAKVHANAMDLVWEMDGLRFVSPHEVTAYAAGLFQKRIRDEFKSGEWSPVAPLYRPKEGVENLQFGLDNREQSVIDSLLEIEAQIYDLRIENAFVVLPDTGEIVFKKMGTVDTVEFTSGETGKAKNAIVCHNHPSGKPPSQEDFMFALDSGMAEIHAYSDETGRHILRFNTDLTALERNRLRNAYTAARSDMKVITDEKWLSKEFNDYEAWTALSAGTLERVEHGWPDWFDYTHEPSPLQNQ